MYFGRLARRPKELVEFAKAHHATLAERVKYVEQLLGDSADKHAAELEALKA